MNKDEKDFEKQADAAKRVRGQLITYAMNLHSMQPRVFSFQLLLCGSNARIIRWDRTGAVVTELFDWTQGAILYEFLYRFNAATPKQRGLDTTARKALPEEKTQLRAALQTAGYSETDAMQPPFYVYSVSQDAQGFTLPEPREFVAGRPVAHSRAFTGRASTGYICYEMAAKQLHFMKDAWRSSTSTARLDEPRIYRRLNALEVEDGSIPDDGEDHLNEDTIPGLSELHNPAPEDPAALSAEPRAVPHVATLLCGGDVYDLGDQTAAQVTFEHNSLPREEIPLQLDDDASPPSRPARPMQKYIHFRMVLVEVGESLDQFTTVPELLQILMDVIVGTFFSFWGVVHLQALTR